MEKRISKKLGLDNKTDSGLLNRSSKVNKSKETSGGSPGDLKSMSIIEELRNEAVKSMTTVNDSDSQ